MAQKTFVINQACTINGQKQYCSARITCDEADIDATLAPLKLQGEVTILEEKSKTGTSDISVTAYNYLNRITMRNASVEKSTGIYPSKRGLVVENTVDLDAVVTAFKATHPFKSDATVKPERVYPSISAGDVNSAA